jgi:murein DD-endopeptidase MepM/ murein hydrolase activator NlpD
MDRASVLLLAAALLADDPLSIDVRARAIAAGEPLRIVVTSRIPLAAIEAGLDGVPVVLLRDGVERFSGWSLVPLDAVAGDAVLEVHARTGDGTSLAARRVLAIERRSFPEEKLSVAPSYVEPPPEIEERIARERTLLARIYAGRVPFALPEQAFVRPVPGEPTSVFGTRRLFNGKPRDPHPGLDLRAATGTPVRASGPGRVALARDLYYSGQTVLVDHGGGLFTIYAHLSELSVEEGAEAAAGQVIGLSGATGRVTGPHLHWGAKIGERPFDPTALLDPALWDRLPSR